MPHPQVARHAEAAQEGLAILDLPESLRRDREAVALAAAALVAVVAGAALLGWYLSFYR